MFSSNKRKRARRIEDYSYLVAKEQPLSIQTENLQKAILNLEFWNVDRNYKVIQVTSTVASEGKTTVLANLAYLLKQQGKKVLVLDLDLRKPKVHHLTKVPNENGITDYLLGNVDLEQVIIKHELFDHIVAGQRITTINNALNSEKLVDLLTNLKEKYDYIFVDTPPTSVVADPLYTATIVDAVIYIVGQKIAKKKLVKQGIKEIQKGTTPIVGIILSQMELGKKEYHHYYYYEWY